MRSKGFGFVEMSSQSEAEAAIKMFDGFSFGPREIKVNKARPPEERTFSRPDQRYGSKGGGGKNRKPRTNEGYKSRRY
jgi:RNA recognition motif-containing protein